MIVRFVDGRHRIQDECERAEYMSRLGAAIRKTDWKAIAYALMSSHVHLATIAGCMPFDALSRPLHSGFASWLNRRQGCLGPVLAERPKTPTIRLEQAPRLLSYIHNNPVRATVVNHAAESDWSSHGCYIGQRSAPSWLDVDHGLNLCGFGSDVAGRQAFGLYVDQRRHEPRDPLLSCDGTKKARREIRARLRAAIEIGYPEVDLAKRQATYPLIGTEGCHVAPRWDGPWEQVVAEVADETGVPAAAMRTRCKIRRVAHAKKLVVAASHLGMGRTYVEIAALLSITPEAASKLLQRLDESGIEVALALAHNVMRRSSR